MYIIELTYKVSLDLVEQHIDAHKEYLSKAYQNNLIMISGRKKPRTGGIIISLHPSLEDAEIWIENDPFYIHELIDYKIIEFMPTQCSTAIAEAIMKDEICQS